KLDRGQSLAEGEDVNDAGLSTRLFGGLDWPETQLRPNAACRLLEYVERADNDWNHRLGNARVFDGPQCDFGPYSSRITNRRRDDRSSTHNASMPNQPSSSMSLAPQSSRL